MDLLLIRDCLSLEQQKLWDGFPPQSEGRRNIAQSLVNKRIKENPDFEVWGDCVYFPLFHGTCIREGNKKIIKYDHLLVSNLGRVYNKDTKMFIAHEITTKDYVRVYTGDSRRALHRLVAGVFCPRPAHHKKTPLTSLQVNHRSGCKENNKWFNLEWVTNGENQIHAHKTGLQPNLKGINRVGSIPMKGTVVDIPEHNGKVIVVCGGDDYKEFGLYANSLWQIREGKMSKHKGCTWEVCDIQEYSRLKASNCIELAKAMKDFVTVITYRLTHKETGHVIDGLTGMQLRDQYGFNDTHLKGTWKKQGTIKGYSVQRYEDGEELIPPAKPIQQIKRWVLVGENKAGIIKINKPEDFIVYGFNKANVMRSMKLGFKATHPTTGVKYNVLEANFKK